MANANQSPPAQRTNSTRKPPPQAQVQSDRVAQMPQSQSAAAPANVRRDTSPSPSLRERERQRYVRTQSMPIVSSHPHPDFDFDGAQVQPQAQAPPPHSQSYGRPIPISRVSQPQLRGPGGQGPAEKWQMTDDLQADIDRADLLHQQQQQHQQRQGSRSPVPPTIPSVPSVPGIPNIPGAPGVGLPISGVQLPPPGQPPAPGTAGVAYAGGVASAGAAFVSHVKTHSSGSVTGNVSGVGVSVGTSDIMDGSQASVTARRRTTAAATASAMEQAVHRASPLSFALRKGANTSPGYPGMPSMPSPRSTKNRTPDRSLPVQEEPDEHDQHQHVQHQQGQRPGSRSGGVGGRITPSPAPSSDLNPTNDLDHDGEGTLVDLSDDDDDDRSVTGGLQGPGESTSGSAAGSGSGSGDGSHTPRSPIHSLFPHSHGVHGSRSIHEVLLPDKQVNGSKGGGQGFNPGEFQQTLKKLQSSPHSQHQYPSHYPHAPPHVPHHPVPPPVPPPPFSPFSRIDYSRNESRGSYPNWMFDFYHNYPAEDIPVPPASGMGVNGAQGGGEYCEYDEAVNAYMSQFLPPANGAGGAYPTPISTQGQGDTGTGMSTGSGRSQQIHARPDAPIPPTPHSQTSAPTPFHRRPHQNGNEDEDGDQNELNGQDEGRASDQERQKQEDNNENEMQQRFVPPFSPAPPSGTPYPYPFSHVRRGFVYPRPTHVIPPPPSTIPRVPSSVYDPNVVQEQLRLQMQMYAYNNYNNGGMTDSTISQASTPYPGMGPGYTPFGAFLNQSRAYARARERLGAGGMGMGGGVEDVSGRTTGLSMRSSPSHLPVALPSLPHVYPGRSGGGAGRGVRKREGRGDLRGGKINGVTGGAGGAGNGVGVGGRGRERVKPPPRVDSTQPRETSPEDLSSGEETAGEKYEDQHRENNDRRRQSTDAGGGWPNGVGHEDEENGEWVDEESDEEGEDLLDLEYHPSYVSNPERRRKRWDQRWEDLARAFRALDRETDTTLLLLASPQHTNKLYSLSSRSIRRDSSLFDGHATHGAKSAFEQIASQRATARSSRGVSLLERLYASSMSSAHSNASQSQSGQSGDGSGSPGDAGNEPTEREEDLRRMLRTALHSLGALHQMYEEREMRWRIEERKMREEREGVDLLIQQAFGSNAGIAGQSQQPMFEP